MRSPAAPSNDRTAIANALINNRWSRRSGRAAVVELLIGAEGKDLQAFRADDLSSGQQEKLGVGVTLRNKAGWFGGFSECPLAAGGATHRVLKSLKVVQRGRLGEE